MQFSQLISILLHPRSEWSRVFVADSGRRSYIRYGLFLTVLMQVAMFIGTALKIGELSASGTFVFGWRFLTLYEGIHVILDISMLYLIPWLLAFLARLFGGQDNTLHALKLFVFAMTPVWIGLMFLDFPVIGDVAIAGLLYGIILFGIHAGEAMNIPKNKKSIAYVANTLLCIVTITLLFDAVSTTIASSFYPT